MAIPSGSGTEVLKTTFLNTTSDIANNPHVMLATTTDKINTIISLLVTNTHGSTAVGVNLYWNQTGTASSPNTGSGNLYLLMNQSVPAKQTFIFSDRIVLPQHAGSLYISTEAAHANTDILFSYIQQDWT